MHPLKVKSDFVVALVATYQRPKILDRLLKHLKGVGNSLGAVVIVDNGNDEETKCIVETSSLEVFYYSSEENLGCGGGLRKAEELGIEKYGDRATHYWILDDDVVLVEGCLEVLLSEMKKVSADLLAPLLSEENGDLWAFPEPKDSTMRRIIRQVKTPKECLKALGKEPIQCCWATGACQLIHERVLSEIGFHRTDFWVLGEDLEFSMRICHKMKGFFTCKVEVPHLPPPPIDAKKAKVGGYVKFCCLLQNLSYLAIWEKHSQHMWRYLPGNYFRFFRKYGMSFQVLWDALFCFFGGIFMKEAAGGTCGVNLRKRILGYKQIR